MIPFVLVMIVEGESEVASMPVLVRRLHPLLPVARPLRVKRNRIIKDGELERYVQVADAAIVERNLPGAVLLLLDADDDCPVQLAPTLEQRMRATLTHRLVRCVVANRETESWLVAGDHNASPINDEHRPTKSWLKTKHGLYSPTVDQPRLVASLDVDLAQQRSRSFRRFAKVLDEISHAAGQAPN